MKLSVEELLKPRYEVIADFPNCMYEVGKILKGDIPEFYNKYPHLFKPLQWWERRDISEMPEYLKHESGGVDKIEKWDMETLFGYTDIKNRRGCSLLSWKAEYGYFPATPEEYSSYKQSIKS